MKVKAKATEATFYFPPRGSEHKLFYIVFKDEKGDYITVFLDKKLADSLRGEIDWKLKSL